MLRAVIHNGDDAPLKITRARLQQYERRIYFDCDAGASPALYYGDDKLNAPVYDYAKLFQSDASAAQVQLGAEEANAAIPGRPDDRPWSERHPAVLWAAILAAVAILGGIAMRSLKSAASDWFMLRPHSVGHLSAAKRPSAAADGRYMNQNRLHTQTL